MTRKRFVLPLVIASLVPCVSCLAGGDFEKSTRLSADGKTIASGKNWATAALAWKKSLLSTLTHNPRTLHSGQSQ